MSDEHHIHGAHAHAQPGLHPLEPLTAEEIKRAVDILRTEREISEHVRFVSVNLNELPKEVVLNFHTGDAIAREAFIVLLDSSTGATYETIVSITGNQVKSWRHIPGVQPSIMPDELAECETLLKS